MAWDKVTWMVGAGLRKSALSAPGPFRKALLKTLGRTKGGAPIVFGLLRGWAKGGKERGPQKERGGRTKLSHLVLWDAGLSAKNSLEITSWEKKGHRSKPQYALSKWWNKERNV